MRHVRNPPSIKYHDNVFPDIIKKTFPSAENSSYSNGVISFTLQAINVKDSFEQPLTFLVGFRQYLHYHFHAIKASLHTRMRKRVDTFEMVMKRAKREVEAPKKFKETHGGEIRKDAVEEEKKEEVFTYKK